MTFGSLFAGIGGFDLGFERAGMQCRWQVEIDEYANRVLAKHWPRVARWKDIKTFPPAYGDWSVDVICGGFPCQDISYAGKGAGLQGERSGLFYEAIRVIREVGPRIVVLENVAALLTRGMDHVLGTLASIGFDAEWHCIPAAAVGAPHIRDRVFVFGTRKATSNLFTNTKGERRRERRQGGTACFSEREKNSAILADTHSERLERPELQRERIIIMQRTSHSCWWSAEPAVGRVANGISNRVHRMRALGNAVVPQVAEYIGRQIMEAAK
jgi:DNA (cytosine-5)-methyltransferase 1